MHKWNNVDSLHRTGKLAMDSGEASSIEEAEKIFKGYKLTIEVGPDIADSPTRQAMLLTAVNTGRRCFLGGVEVTGNVNTPLLVQWRDCRTLAEAILNLHGQIVTTMTPEKPRILIGNVHHPVDIGEFAIRATFDGWSGGVIPFEDAGRLPEKQEFIPAGVLAGAVAVSEAFQYVRQGNVMAGRRDMGLSLWQPEAGSDWQNASNGPEINELPSKLWLIGLGHLGQAFLWTLGLLPYKKPEDVLLVLQDYDVLTEANDSTSLLTFPSSMSKMKTRAMAEWCESRGFRTIIHERRFGSNFKIAEEEPTVVFCGVDNAPARAVLEEVGFRRIIEAGLGKGLEEYLAFQINTFPGHRKALDIWGNKSLSKTKTLDYTDQPAYQGIGDKCGLTMLAGRSVGASFVGATVSALAVSELIRMCHGNHQYSLIDGSLRSLEYRQAINHRFTEPFNPGTTKLK